MILYKDLNEKRIIVKRNLQKGSAHLIIFIVLCAALVGSVGFIFYQNFIAKNDDVANFDDSSNVVIDQYNGWQTFANTKDGYVLKYPKGWVVNTHQDHPSKPIYTYFKPNEDSPFDITISSRASEQTPEAYANEQWVNSISNKVLINSDIESIDGKDTYCFTFNIEGNVPITYICLIKNDSMLFSISMIDRYGSAENAEYIGYYKLLVKSIKFDK